MIDDPEKMYQTIIGLQQKGVSLRSISKRFGRSRNWAHSYIQRFKQKIEGAAEQYARPS